MIQKSKAATTAIVSKIFGLPVQKKNYIMTVVIKKGCLVAVLSNLKLVNVHF